MKTTQKLLIALISSPLFINYSSAVETNLNPEFIGKVTFGYSQFNNNYGGKLAWGFGADARIIPELQFGIEYRRSKLESNDSFDLSAHSFLGNAMYRMPAGKNHFLVGLEFGQTTLDVSANLGIFSATLASEKKLSVGPRVGYDMSLGTNWEASANLDYLLTFSDPKLSSIGASVSVGYKY